jgi:hypothetical protein
LYIQLNGAENYQGFLEDYNEQNRLFIYIRNMSNTKGFIRWKGYPTNHAMRAYREGYFVEAIQVLHGFLEAKMQELLMVSRHGNIVGSLKEVWDITQELSFNALSKALFISGRISQSEYKDLQKFNSIRNKLIHKFFLEPYEKDYQGIPKKDYDKVFHAGIDLVEFMDTKTGYLMSRRKGRKSGSKRQLEATHKPVR